MSQMAIQYQLGNGNWTACGDRTGEFVARAVAFAAEHNARWNAIGYRRGYLEIVDEISAQAALAAGHEIPFGRDWYSQLRQTPAQRPTPTADPRPVLRCRCGNAGYAGAYPFSTLPGSGRCDDCV